MNQPTQLSKKLTLYGLTMIAVGSCIGSGIFVAPGQIVSAVGNHTLVLLVWLLGGVIALTGALTFAELGSLFPKAGGVYVFLKEAFGDFWGFLYGWAILLVITSGALAALAMAFADYMSFFFSLTETHKIIIASATLLFLTGINAVGIDMTQWFANIFTGLKLLAILAIIGVGFLFYDSSKVVLDFSLTNTPDNIIGAMILGLVGVLFSMGGWHHASYLAEETINAKRNVPRAMILGVIVVMVVYLLVNLAYMLLLPLDAIASSDKVAGDAVGSVFSIGGKLVAIGIAISIFGTIGIYTVTAPRIYYAMAKDGVFFPQFAKLHPRWKTPFIAMFTQAIWAIILIFILRTFTNLITYVTFMDILFMTMAGVSIFIFRRKFPERERLVKVWGYPMIPLIFVLISSAFVVGVLLDKPQQAWGGLVVVGLGLPFYWYFKRKKAHPS